MDLIHCWLMDILQGLDVRKIWNAKSLLLLPMVDALITIVPESCQKKNVKVVVTANPDGVNIHGAEHENVTKNHPTVHLVMKAMIVKVVHAPGYLYVLKHRYPSVVTSIFITPSI